MKSFEQMYSEFYGAEIDDVAQINLYSHSGTELKDFVNYCIEQAGINPPVMQAEGSAFDCTKYNKREGQSCDLNNNCKYPNCAMGAAVGKESGDASVSDGK